MGLFGGDSVTNVTNTTQQDLEIGIDFSPSINVDVAAPNVSIINKVDVTSVSNAIAAVDSVLSDIQKYNNINTATLAQGQASMTSAVAVIGSAVEGISSQNSINVEALTGALKGLSASNTAELIIDTQQHTELVSLAKKAALYGAIIFVAVMFYRRRRR
jgi:xanthine/uracil/vitamin C permease (AzgA family)